MDINTELRHLMTQIHESTLNLKDFISSCELVDAAVYSLPSISPEHESDPVSYIDVKPCTEPFQALTMAMHCYGQYYAPINRKISTRFTVRMPGYLFLKSDHVDIGLSLICQLNSLKQQFESFVVKHIPVQDQRFKILHEHLFPGLMTLQLYRQIIVSEQHLRSVRFFWNNKMSILKRTRDEIISGLRKSQVNPGRSLLADEKESWFDAVEREIELISNCSFDTEFRIRRPIRVQPMVRFSTFYPNDIKPKSMACPMPAIVFLPPHSQPPKVRALSSYSETDIKHRRDPKEQRQYNTELLIPRMHLYKII